MTADDLVRRGYESEKQQHRERLARALNEVRFVLDSLDNQLCSDRAVMNSDTRRLLAAAGDAVQAAGALSAAEQLSFGFDGNS